MNKSIYLSPSLQDKNIGIGGYGTEEERMNQLADIIEPLLKSCGFTVYRNNPNWTLKQAVDDSNIKKPDIHVALHSNANDGKSRGCEVFCHKLEGPSYDLAKYVYTELSSITPVNDRGVKEGYNFYGNGQSMYELKNTKARAILVEVSFHDNIQDSYWIINNMDNIAMSIIKGIFKYFDYNYTKEWIDLVYSLNILKKYNIISTPNYWLSNALKGKTVNGEFAGILINNIAKYLTTK